MNEKMIYTKKELEATMKLKGLTQRGVADMMGISESYLSKLIAGERESQVLEDEMKRILQPELGKVHNLVNSMAQNDHEDINRI